MKTSSKNRLTPGQQDLYPGNNLFHKIARAVCRAGTLPRKELYESWEMARRIRRRFRGGRVLDLACGHGLLAHILLILDDSSHTALAVDRHIPPNAVKLSGILTETWPRLKHRIHYLEQPIQEIEIFPEDLVVSAHACGDLSDLVIDKAVTGRARVAVMPCCHDAERSGTGSLEGWMDKSLAVDVVRAFRLRQNGYRIFTQKIPQTITPKNRLLMGEYITPCLDETLPGCKAQKNLQPATSNQQPATSNQSYHGVVKIANFSATQQMGDFRFKHQAAGSGRPFWQGFPVR